MSRAERKALKVDRKQAEQRGRQRRRWLRAGARWVVLGLAAVVVTGGLGFWILTTKRLPPTSMANHVEDVPPAHILTTPMPLAVQKHMLEHADGGGPPGVIINYNCEDYRCAPDTVARLEAVARAYPTFVYLAPFEGMDAKIAVTRLGGIIILDNVDEARIHAFIRD